MYLIELPDHVVPIASRAGSGPTTRSTCPCCRLGKGFTGWVALHGEPILVNDANLDPRGATIAGTEDVDESMLVVPMRYDGMTIGVITLSKLGLDGFGSDDLRVLTILADRAATAGRVGPAADPDPGPRPRAAPAARHERRAVGSLDPRQVANLMAGHLAGHGRRRMRHQLLGPVDRPGRSRWATTRPSGSRRWSRFDVSRYPETCASSSGRTS